MRPREALLRNPNPRRNLAIILKRKLPRRSGITSPTGTLHPRESSGTEDRKQINCHRGIFRRASGGKYPRPPPHGGHDSPSESRPSSPAKALSFPSSAWECVPAKLCFAPVGYYIPDRNAPHPRPSQPFSPDDCLGRNKPVMESRNSEVKTQPAPISSQYQNGKISSRISRSEPDGFGYQYGS